MKITDYAFGRITIDGNTYSKDLIIYSDHVHSPWWRKEGHLLQTEDLSGIITAKVSLLIIGTGYNGAMAVPQEVLDYLKSHNIKSIVAKTGKAVELYNKNAAALPAAAFHLTC
jgi:hypothetical protein